MSTKRPKFPEFFYILRFLFVFTYKSEIFHWFCKRNDDFICVISEFYNWKWIKINKILKEKMRKFPNFWPFCGRKFFDFPLILQKKMRFFFAFGVLLNFANYIWFSHIKSFFDQINGKCKFFVPSALLNKSKWY